MPREDGRRGERGADRAVREPQHGCRPFDVSNGQEIWRGRLPTPAIATPMSYEWQGKQYIVIYSGGYARLDTELSDQVIAFTLPD